MLHTRSTVPTLASTWQCAAGMLIGYALAADHPDRVVRVALGEAPLPGITPPTPLVLPDPVVDRLWHIPFNQLKETNKRLVAGREDIYFGAEFSASAGTHKLPGETVQYYVDGLRDPDALHGSFQGSMAADTMKLAADDVQTLVIPDTGHWLAEQAPEQLLAALTAFLAPYREALVTA